MAVVEEGNDPVHRGQPLHYALSFYLFLSLPLLFTLYPFSLSLAIPQSQTEHSCALLSVYVPTVHRRTNERYHLTHTHVRRGSVHVRLRAWKKTSGSADIYGQIWDKDKRSIENRFSLFSGQYVFSLFRFPEKDRWNPQWPFTH